MTHACPFIKPWAKAHEAIGLKNLRTNKDMARIIGDYTGTTFKDFLILPGYTEEHHAPERVDISTELAPGVKLLKPFLPAAMRSVVGKEMALESSRMGMMPVAPRGLTIELEAEIVRHVKDNMVPVGGIESNEEPVCISDKGNLADALAVVHEYGHSNIPVTNRLAELVGMFTYKHIDHDRMDPGTPVGKVITPFRREGDTTPYCTTDMPDDKIKEYMRDKNLRFVPVVDHVSRLIRLVFMQKNAAYLIGAAVDTYEGWEERAKVMIDAGADMIFTDTSDADSSYETNLIKRYKMIAGMVSKYKDRFPDGLPICAGNVVTRDGFKRLADAGADVIKVGMGSGSICTTNVTLGIGAPPFWAMKEVADARDEYYKNTGRYIPLIGDGGIQDAWDMNVALTHMDDVMCGRLFAGFAESAGALVWKDGQRWKEYWGEGSKRAAETSGDLRRYHMGSGDGGPQTYQGVDSLVPYAGRIKHGGEEYTNTLRLALSHTGSANMSEYRWNATLVRISEKSRQVAFPHGVFVKGD